MLARQIAFGFGIAIILPLLVYYAVATVYPAPKWNDFVSSSEISSTATPLERSKIEEKRRAERQAYEAAARSFARAHIVVAAPVGIVAILIGAFVAMHTIGTGLILGGIVTVAWGYYGYWQHLDNWMRFVSLLIAFIVLIVLALKCLPGGRARPAAN